MYLDAAGQWTTRPENARNFSSGQEAIVTARTHGLRAGRMHYIFREAAMNFFIPLGEGVRQLRS